MFWEMGLGIFLLIMGSEIFVRGAVAMARLLKWSPLVIGATVVAIGTSLPELTVSILAATKGDYGLALGNIVGSNIVNSFLILAAGICAGQIRIGTTKTPKNAAIMLFSSIFYWFWHTSGNGGNIYWTYLALFLVTIFSTLEIWWAWWGKSHEDEHLNRKTKEQNKLWILTIPLAIYLISIGGNLMVSSIEELSLFWGVSTTLLGLVLSSVATSLPELATTLIGLGKREEKLVMGNILGSNIYNLLLVGGIIGLWGKDAILPSGTWIIFLISAVTTVIIVEIYKGKQLPKNLIFWLVLGFVSYLISVFYKL